MVHSDKGVVVDVCEEAHDELAIHAVGDTAVTGDRVAEVLELKCPLETRGKEAAEGGDEGSKGGEDQGVELHGLEGNGEGRVVGKEEELGEGVFVGDEDGVRIAFEAGEDVRAKVLDRVSGSAALSKAGTYVNRANKVLGSSHDVDENHAEKDSHDPGADEALDRLLGRKLDQLGAAKGDTADIGEDVVCNDESGRQEEPDHALEDVVHDEMGLDDDEVQRHVCPSEVCKLKFIVACLQRCDKEDESCHQKVSIKTQTQGIARLHEPKT